MKKLIALGAATMLVAFSGNAAIDWSSVDNIAKGAEVIASSNDGQSYLITDGNDGTRWQASPSTHAYTQDWVLIRLVESVEFTDIEIVWEASHAKAYSVYVSDTFEVEKHMSDTEDFPSYSEVYIDGLEPVAQGGDDSEGNYTESLTLTSPVTSALILIYCDEYNNNGNNYGASIFEVKVANVQGRDEVSSLTVSQNAVTEGESTTVIVTPLNSAGETLDISKVSDLSLTCSDPSAVEISGGENGEFSVKGIVPGSYTLTAKASADGEEVSGYAEFIVNYNWADKTNVATSKTASARQLADSENDNPASNAVDGEDETYYQYNGEWGGGDAWVIVDLGKEYVVDVVGVYYPDTNNNSGTFKFSFGGEDAVQPGESDYKWTSDSALEGWTSSETLNRTRGGVATYVLPVSQVIRYIAVRDVNNPGGKPQVGEIYVSGVEYADPVATKVTVSCDKDYIATDEKVILTGVVYNQFDAEMEAEIVYYVNDEAIEGNEYQPEAVGTYTLTAKSESLESEPVVLHVIADAASRLTNPSFQATLNEEPIETNPFTNEVQFAELNQPLTIYFEKPYEFSLIRLEWEAACPSDYTVKAIYGDGTDGILFSLEGRAFENGVNPVDRIYTQSAPKARVAASSGVDGDSMKNIEGLEILPTAKDHGYNLRLLKVSAYGAEDVESGVENVAEVSTTVDVYNMNGILLRQGVEREKAVEGLPAGLYIVGDKKMIVK